jgi:hypothetical protein
VYLYLFNHTTSAGNAVDIGAVARHSLVATKIWSLISILIIIFVVADWNESPLTARIPTPERRRPSEMD